MMIQGAVLGAVAATIAVLVISLGFCVNDNLNQRNNFSELHAAVKAANKHNKEAKEERESENKRITDDSNTKYDTMRANLTARLGIMHNDRNKWLDKYYPVSGKDAKGLPPVCFNRVEFNRSQRLSEEAAAAISDKGETYRQDLNLAKDWASRQRWEQPTKEDKGNFLLEFINSDSGNSDDGGGGGSSTSGGID